MPHAAKVHARFIEKASGNPLTGEGWSVQLLDKDPLSDDLLGEECPDAQGRVTFLFELSSVSSPDSPRERRPDLFFRLLRDGRTRFETRVHPDVDFLARDRRTGLHDLSALVQDLGTFEVG